MHNSIEMENILQEFTDIFKIASNFSIKQLIEMGNDCDVNLDTEVFQVRKGDVKTTFTVKFDKEGFPISFMHSSEIIKKMETNK